MVLITLIGMATIFVLSLVLQHISFPSSDAEAYNHELIELKYWFNQMDLDDVSVITGRWKGQKFDVFDESDDPTVLIGTFIQKNGNQYSTYTKRIPISEVDELEIVNVDDDSLIQKII